MRSKTNFNLSADGKEFTFEESLGGVIFISIISVIGGFGFIASIFNLLIVRPLPLGGLIASLAWIALMSSIVVSGCRKMGIRQYLVQWLGEFVRNRFAIFNTDETGTVTISFGYKVNTSRHYLLKVIANGITRVDWGPGQGNDPTRDNSWIVFMHFEREAVVFDGGQSKWSLCSVGPSSPKAGRELCGEGFMRFLAANGVRLQVPPKELLGQTADVAETRPIGKSRCLLNRIKIGGQVYFARAGKLLTNDANKFMIEEIRGTTVYVRQVSPEAESPAGA